MQMKPCLKPSDPEGSPTALEGIHVRGCWGRHREGGAEKDFENFPVVFGENTRFCLFKKKPLPASVERHRSEGIQHQ